MILGYDMQRVALTLLLVLISSVMLVAFPPSLGQFSYRLISPEYLGGGLHVTNGGSAHSGLINPALPAASQRLVFNGNYTYMHDFSSQNSGHAFNLAGIIPSKRGVFSVGAGIIDTSQFVSSALDMGSLIRFSTAFSKKIYSDLWFGFGIDGGFGNIDSVSQFGAGLNIGFMHFPESFGGLKNFRWGGAVHGLGIYPGSQTRGYLNAVPDNLTIAAGIAFEIVETAAFSWTLRTDVRMPAVTDLGFGVSNELNFNDFFSINIASSLRIRDAFDGAWQTIIPAVNLGLNFSFGDELKGDNKISTTEMDIRIAAAPLYSGIWGFSTGLTVPVGVTDKSAPIIEGAPDEMRYISPNYNGVMDALILPYSVKDARYIARYKWEVEDETGNIVKTFVNKDERPENESIGNLWNRLFLELGSIKLPEVFRWDGVGDSGSIVADGKYRAYLQFSDDNGNTSRAGPYHVVLDTQNPEINLEIPEGIDLIFSPDGDGVKEDFEFRQSGSVENLWTVNIKNAAGLTVFSRKWENNAPAKWNWNGRDDSDQIVSDGVYHYEIAGKDLAGNENNEVINNIIIDTRQPNVDLLIDKNIFSPGTGSEYSSINFSPELSSRNGIVKWNLSVMNELGDTVHRFSAVQSIPAQIAFDGIDDSGEIVKEGQYYGVLTVVYRNGFQPEINSPLFEVDLTKPEANISANWNLFSPQSESSRSSVTFTQESSREQLWTGIINNSNGKKVKTWQWMGIADRQLVWDGRNADGRIVANGSYNYRLESTDSAGNRGYSRSVTVSVDSTSVEASISASLDAFSPDGNRLKDNVRFFMKAREDSPVREWILQVENNVKSIVREWKGSGIPPESVDWNGRSGAGNSLPDGEYTAGLNVLYEKGDRARAKTGRILLDTVAPSIVLSVNNTLFSPDGDGQKDLIQFQQKAAGEGSFESFITNAKGETVWNRNWSSGLENWSWNGYDKLGNGLPDGVYKYIVRSTDSAGNTSSEIIDNIGIDTAPTPVYITAAQAHFRAGEDNRTKQQKFNVLFTNKEGIAHWIFTVEDINGKAVYTESGKGKPGSEFNWDGRTSAGEIAEGEFTGALNVIYDKGARPKAKSRKFVSDASRPIIDLNVVPVPFSPDDDGVDDEVFISLAVDDLSPIQNWTLNIDDPRGKHFVEFKGEGMPAERIIWDGRSRTGELVSSAEDYPYTLEVTDVLGYKAVRKGIIPIDVLVIREGIRLKILINNITFEPSSAKLTTTGERGQKNIQVLDRLAEIMVKYASYKITVEGHAASLKWADAVAAEREQKNILIPLSSSRAESVIRELINRRVDARRLNAEGIGGAKPIVPHRETEQRWRNRRVEFYLEK